MNAPTHPSPRLVAIVDDDPTTTALVTRILARSGCKVLVYASGEELLQQPSLSDLDVVCLDMTLPGIDGLETLRRLRSVHPALPVILFSASSDAIRDEALAAGAVACVDKTKGWAELGTAIERATSRS